MEKLDSVEIRFVSRLKIQEANDLAQVTSGYKVSKEKLEELIEVRAKLISTSISSPRMLTSKPMGVEGLEIMKYMESKEYDVLTIDNMSNED